jgi:hypothetical protein
MKKLLFFSFAIFSVLIAINLINAEEELVTIDAVRVNELYDNCNEDISVIAGEFATIKVYFTALKDASNVRVKAEIEGEKIDVSDKKGPFDLEEGKRYVKTLNVKIPYELKDEVSGKLYLEIEIWNSDYKTEHSDVALNVQREPYKTQVMSIDSKSSVEAGENFFVMTTLKNIGYNNLDDVYVTVSIPALNLERTSYLGDIISVEYEECEDSCYYSNDKEDTIQGKFYLEIPYNTEPGIYTLEVEVNNEDIVTTEEKQIIIKNDFASGNLIVNTIGKTFSVGENAEYSLLITNPTNKLKVYNLLVESPSELRVDIESSMIAIPAGSSKTITLDVSSKTSGEYQFNVNLFSGSEIESVKTLKADVTENQKIDNPMIILTIILAIVFLVLLVILIVLLGKKQPKEKEDTGESYY